MNKICITYKSSRILLHKWIVTFSDSNQGICQILRRMIIRKTLAQVQWLVLQTKLEIFNPNQTKHNQYNNEFLSFYVKIYKINISVK